ncbi:uracil-DNA glycosylase family protein [Paenibacillus sp. UNC451MF]|uniref:uracil-DNA glycosylase family protein n=1 Tax=Paenibacillus sp. UNC451MF TaxID=1449063 RepID=UPI00048E03B6|nr:uracil-DNA glycosylase family protein [Paenibacillus sp. UNC451MF]
MYISNHFKKYKQAILRLPKDTVLTKEVLLVDDFLMERSGQLEMYYAPHNEYSNPSAKVVIVGLTPGWNQMRIAMQEARFGLEEGISDEEVCRKAKEAARFAGTMRNELIRMLDALELHRYLTILSCGALFHEQQRLLHSTSLLRYPVFVSKNNYSGTHPNLLSSEFLLKTALSFMLEELKPMKQALIIPLGKRVEDVLQLLVREGRLDAEQCLWGFPHPSGANGHRHKQFAYHQEAMRNRIKALF